MANKIIIKRSSVAGKIPLATDLEVGELAVNLVDKVLFTKNASGDVVPLDQNGGGGGAVNGVFYENDQTVNTSYTITTNKNAMSAGPITIASGVTVTIPSGSSWLVL